MAYTKYSLTPANNTAAPPDGAPEGMLPSAVNDTMRDMMAQIRDCGDGIRGGTYTMTAPVITGGSVTGVTAVSTSGNLTFTGTGNRILGDFTSGGASLSNRVMFQTSTTNSNTIITAMPNGTGTAAGVSFFTNSSDPTNSTLGAITVGGARATYQIDSTITGTGTYLPIAMYTGGSERLRIDTSGNVLVGITSARANAGDVQVSKGISFPATQSAQSDANTLDDYEEGTFTPAYGGTGSNPTVTYGAQVGRYTKIGNRVYVQLTLDHSAKSGGSGTLTINLPFQVSAVTNNFPSFLVGYSGAVTPASKAGYTDPGRSDFFLQAYNLSTGNYDVSALNANGTLMVSAQYQVD